MRTGSRTRIHQFCSGVAELGVQTKEKKKNVMLSFFHLLSWRKLSHPLMQSVSPLSQRSTAVSPPLLADSPLLGMRLCSLSSAVHQDAPRRALQNCPVDWNSPQHVAKSQGRVERAGFCGTEGSEANVRKTVSGLQTREDASFSLEPLYPFSTWKMSPELPKPSSKSYFSSSLSRLSQSELVTRFPTTVTPSFSCTAYSYAFSSLHPKGKRSWPILLYVPQTWKHNSSDDNDES